MLVVTATTFIAKASSSRTLSPSRSQRYKFPAVGHEMSRRRQHVLVCWVLLLNVMFLRAAHAVVSISRSFYHRVILYRLLICSFIWALGLFLASGYND